MHGLMAMGCYNSLATTHRVHHKSPILPSAAPNIKAKEMAFKLREQETRQGPEFKTSTIIVDDNDGSCVYNKQWENGLTKLEISLQRVGG